MYKIPPGGRGSIASSRPIRSRLSYELSTKDTLENKVEIRKFKATGSADRDFLVIYSGHG